LGLEKKLFFPVPSSQSLIPDLHIGNKPGDILVIYRLNYGGLAKIALVFSRLGGENMAGKSVPSLYLAAAGLLETLSSSSVCLDLRHSVLLI
jgi:hypothetical protein